jgi:hypothetical protein
MVPYGTGAKNILTALVPLCSVYFVRNQAWFRILEPGLVAEIFGSGIPIRTIDIGEPK